MSDQMLQQIEALHQEDDHQAIVDLIQAVPPGERDYQLTCLLARAYINLDDPQGWETALALLQSVAAEGKEDPDWWFRTGGVLCRLLRKAEAEKLFETGYAMLPPDSPELAGWRQRCQLALLYCQQELDRQSARERYNDSLDTKKARDFVTYGVLLGQFPVPSQMEGDTIYIPQWQARVIPQVEQITRQGAVLDLWLEAPQLGKTLFECSVGMGQSPSQALAMAGAGFLFTFAQGLARMEERLEPRELTTTFAGKTHRWEMYPSDIAGMGSAPAPEGQVYWDLLQEDIAKRLGNQKLCYVKIYGAKVNGEVTGECRVDDVKSEELSRKVARLVEQWDVPQFASQKQFFFIRQAEETTLPDPYLGTEGRKKLREAAVKAARLFQSCRTEEDYDTFVPRLAAEIGDVTLAAECQAFLPEICAAQAFPQLEGAESVELDREGLPQLTVYKNQLADYHPLGEALMAAFREGEFGKETDGIYRKLVGYSATYQVVQQMQEKGSKLEGCRLASMIYRMGADFEVR